MERNPEKLEKGEKGENKCLQGQEGPDYAKSCRSLKIFGPFNF